MSTCQGISRWDRGFYIVRGDVDPGGVAVFDPAVGLEVVVQIPGILIWRTS